ncbi:ribose-phosphate diphosphokinase [Desulfococcus multivorans]|nr:ribose-phosphate pyrophosphokinase [Desulfococcus multivorans]
MATFFENHFQGGCYDEKTPYPRPRPRMVDPPLRLSGQCRHRRRLPGRLRFPVCVPGGDRRGAGSDLAAMTLSLIPGTANPALAEAIVGRLGMTATTCRIEAFPDDELQVRIGHSLAGSDVYIVQSTGPPVGRNLLELLLIADAARRAGAMRVTAVVPYFGYARQDRRTDTGEPVGAKVLADMIATRADQMITVHLHNPAIEGFFSLPVEHLLPTRLIAGRLKEIVSGDAVLVAPDLGAVKLTQRYADDLDLPVAYVHKERVSGERVAVRRIIGEIADRSPIVVDDMISTGRTLISTIEALGERGCRLPATVAVTHALPVEGAVARLMSHPVGSIIATNSLVQTPERPAAMEILDLAPLIAEAIRRRHEKTSAAGH